ncbi:TPA: VRR-NUC domain-containing protein [Burkholderia multivorans]|uniref:VRR-NUC domain-containing protein n=1 Tax=Burkholderia multivorans TaxID=87883 RepID=UPI001C22680A|nr:VRR-NUC domain-containing protein [Burkholderia multivorans]MBU9392368.1 VRR-NUC domain-containing protein [Burkholderia multivorans]HDR9837981.1 VRR-NUC domain-containing protein [Burkholderia multivorans]HDR9843005.1 VRR-NUC domain-containing protein [Burkholderia multivorans]HDR9850124.1 VRR-NUC domain-containing protein [Burkholderia multivorans]
MTPSSPQPPAFYYLTNFERALAWLGARYDDLLDAAEHAFLRHFATLPQASRALLVRMLMRNGPDFRASKLVYDEIGCPLDAAAPLVECGWIDPAPALTLDTLFALSTKAELLQTFPALAAHAGERKADWLERLRPAHDAAQTLDAWCPTSGDRVLRVTVGALCDRLRLMFFGNLHQDWSEFVLADLGVFQYETVPFGPSSRAFRQRGDVDAYLALHACREALDAWPDDRPFDALLDAIDAIDCAEQPWLATRRAKLLFALGQTCERRADWAGALDAYARSAWPGSRHRRIRVLERCGRDADAFALALEARGAYESDEERQRVERMLPRLQRRLGRPVERAAAAPAVPRETLVLARPDVPASVEYVVRDHLAQPEAPVHYVENTLINSLFGLLCWEPVFAAVPGAFFHPFQRGPADLHAPDFAARRADAFAACFAQLDSGAYRDTIRRHYATKAGLQSPFVFWGVLTDELLEQALACLPPDHLRLWFVRLLADIRGNRSGLPDLVRFWPDERRYELIEVKGPGDRLQDNQTRWLAYCIAHGMPVRVVDVEWADARAAHAGAAAMEWSA